MGKLDLNELFKFTTKERMLKYHVYLYEDMLKNKLAAVSVSSRKRVTQIFSILDLKGVSMGTLMDGKVQEFLKTTMTTDQDNYPEILYKMFIINAPGMFSMAWSLISSFLDAKTNAKIKVNPSLQELSDYVDLDKIPDFAGGKASSTDWPRVQPGPWNPPLWPPKNPNSNHSKPSYTLRPKGIEKNYVWLPQRTALSLNTVKGQNGELLRIAYRCLC